jgi:hypothetical protein
VVTESFATRTLSRLEVENRQPQQLKLSGAAASVAVMNSENMTIEDRLARVGEIENDLAALHAEQLRLIAAINDDPCAGAPVPGLDKHFISARAAGAAAGVRRLDPDQDLHRDAADAPSPPLSRRWRAGR